MSFNPLMISFNAAINEYLPPEKQILLTNNQAVFQMTYKEYLHFIKSLTLDDYYPSQTERLDIMAVYAFFNLTLNMSYLYETLHFSSTTKKKDSRSLSEWLGSQDLYTEVVPKTGIRIAGDELQFRICIFSPNMWKWTTISACPCALQTIR